VLWNTSLLLPDGSLDTTVTSAASLSPVARYIMRVWMLQRRWQQAKKVRRNEHGAREAWGLVSVMLANPPKTGRKSPDKKRTSALIESRREIAALTDREALQWQAQAEELWRKHPQWKRNKIGAAREIAKTSGRSPHTIRKRLK